jgi:adenylate cyclase
MPKIAFLPDKTDISIEDGETILAASLRAGIAHAHACGGRAHCSTCRVWILEGLEHCSERSELERAIADPLRFGPEVRLALAWTIRRTCPYAPSRQQRTCLARQTG